MPEICIFICNCSINTDSVFDLKTGHHEPTYIDNIFSVVMPYHSSIWISQYPLAKRVIYLLFHCNWYPYICQLFHSSSYIQNIWILRNVSYMLHFHWKKSRLIYNRLASVSIRKGGIKPYVTSALHFLVLFLIMLCNVFKPAHKEL